MLKPFGPTHLVYESGDPLGLLCCAASMIPYVCFLTMIVWFLAKRTPTPIDVAVGTLLSDVVNLMLKNIIREPRPPLGGELRSDYGMPSRHAQFAACACILAMLNTPLRKQTPLFPLFAWSLVGAVAFSRAYLGYHTAAQVVVGTAVGTLFAFYYHHVLRRSLDNWGILRTLHRVACMLVNLVVHV